MNSALKKVKNTFISMSKKDLEEFLSNNKFNDFDKKVIRFKALGIDNNSVMIHLGCTKEELFDSCERIAEEL